MPSSSAAGTEGTPEVKQWSDAELISLAEHMQQEIDVRDRQASYADNTCFPALFLTRYFVLNFAHCARLHFSMHASIGFCHIKLRKDSSVFLAMSPQALLTPWLATFGKFSQPSAML